MQDAGAESIANLDKLRHANGSTATADLRLKMQKTMQTNAAVFRDGPTLAEGVRLIDAIVDEQKDLRGVCVCAACLGDETALFRQGRL